jgi:glycosyltransferase involved in cell wall biosynthesis
MNLVILNVGQNYHIRGGSDKCLFELEDLLIKNGHQAIPFTAKHPENNSSEWEVYFPPRVNFENPRPGDLINFVYSRQAAKALKRLLNSTSIDLAHMHIYYGQLTSSILKPLRDEGIPIVQTLHEYKIVCPVYTLLSNGEICQSCNGREFWRATVKRCNQGSLSRSALSTVESYVSKAFGSVDKVCHFIAVSNFQREKVIELGVPEEKITTVHNFIDTRNIVPNYKQGSYFLYLGRLERVKGIRTLVEAAAKIRDVPILIVGDGTVRPELEKLIEKRKLDHVHLLGFKQGEELEIIIKDCICLIAPSEWYETFGLTLVEAFAHGRPVIASRIGGMTEIVSNGEDGFLVPPGNILALRERMIWMAENRRQAVDLGVSGRQKVETQFNPEVHYQKTMEVYKKVL